MVRRAVIAGCLFLAFAVIVLVLFEQRAEISAPLVQWSNRHLIIAPVGFILLYILTCIFLIPGFLLTYTAGAIFGFLHGTLLVSAGVTLGAGAAFLIGRYFGQAWVERRLAHYPRLQALTQLIVDENWKVVALVRLCPAFPFRICNYLFSVTKIRFSRYLIGTWLGTILPALIHVYIGTVIVTGATESASITRARLGSYLIGVLALLLLLFYVGRLAKRAVNRQLEMPRSPDRAISA